MILDHPVGKLKDIVESIQRGHYVPAADLIWAIKLCIELVECHRSDAEADRRDFGASQ